jgi:hypothetical protein
VTPDRQNQDAAAPIASRGVLVGVLGVAIASGYFLSWGMAHMRSWDTRASSLGVTESALLGTLAAVVGAIAGLALIWSPAARTPRSIGLRVLAAGTTRMMLALTLGVAFLITLAPEGYTFFTALTVACLGCLLGEVAWATSALRKAVGPTHTPPTPTMHTGAAAR